jgi:hypothetical protein
MARDVSAAEEAALDGHQPESEIDAPESEAGDPAAAERARAYKADLASEDAALAALKKFGKRQSEEDLDDDQVARLEADDAGKPAEVPAPAKAAPPEPTPAPDAKAEELLRRLNAAEARARDADAKAKAMEARLARADEWERAAKAAEDGDASPVFEKLKWTQETAQKWIEGGKDAIKPTVAEAKADRAVSEVELLKQEIARRDAEDIVKGYKQTIVQQVPELAGTAPHLSRYYTDPESKAMDATGMAEAIWAFQVRTLKATGVEIDPEVAAAELEKAHAKAAARYGAQPGAVHPGDPAPAKKSETVVPQRSDTAPKKKAALPADPREREKQAEADALAVAKSFRIKRELAAKSGDED